LLLLSGGVEIGSVGECVICEEIAFGCTGMSTALAANNLAVSLLCLVNHCADKIMAEFNNWEI